MQIRVVGNMHANYTCVRSHRIFYPKSKDNEDM